MLWGSFRVSIRDSLVVIHKFQLRITPTTWYCIVLHLYIHILLLSAWAFQKHSQCVYPRTKRQVLRWEKDENRLPEKMVDRTAGEKSLFHKEGPMDAKDLNWAIEVLTHGTKRSSRSQDRRRWREVAEMGRRMRSKRYFAVRPCWALRTKMRTLNCIRPEREREPVKLFSYESRAVREPRKTGNQSSSSTKYRLQRS